MHGSMMSESVTKLTSTHLTFHCLCQWYLIVNSSTVVCSMVIEVGMRVHGSTLVWNLKSGTQLVLGIDE